jgi:4-amino-4-deoxy-L-arabinose transferase-like glycosyltransferase
MKNVLQRLRKYFVSNKYFVILIIFYFLIRLINILSFPIFNDEAIYLDWGWRETHVPGYLYYSLYDAKQPLLMWIFGIMQQVLPNPLFAGRIVSVVAGLLTFLGIFKISEKLFDKKIAILASFLYAIIPIFSFFDRQALMESSISAVGVWSSYYLLKLTEKKSYTYALILGIIFGIGFFIKSSALVFLVSFLISTIFIIKSSSKKGKVLEIVFLTFSAFFCVVLLLIINPEFWSTFSSNSRFTLTFNELMSFPLSTWVNSVTTNLVILFFYFTPVLFILSLIGIFNILKLSFKHKIFLIFFITSLLIETFTVKGATDRYLVTFLPFLTICASFILFYILDKKKVLGLSLIIFSVVIPLSLTFYQIVDFPKYIMNMGNISGYTNSAYLVSNTSGYGINETVNYFKKLSKNENFVIGIAQNTGNPESALQVYFNKKEYPKVVYMDSSLFDINLNDYDCLSTGIVTYFASRDNQQAGLEKFLKKITSFKNPYGENSIGIYKLNEQCKGKTAEISIRKTSE